MKKCPDCGQLLVVPSACNNCGWRRAAATTSDRRCQNHPERPGSISPTIHHGDGEHPGPWYCTECGRAACPDTHPSQAGQWAMRNIRAVLKGRQPGED